MFLEKKMAANCNKVLKFMAMDTVQWIKIRTRIELNTFDRKS